MNWSLTSAATSESLLGERGLIKQVTRCALESALESFPSITRSSARYARGPSIREIDPELTECIGPTLISNATNSVREDVQV